MALTPEQCEQRTILKVLAGSHVHGLNVDPVPCESCKGTKCKTDANGILYDDPCEECDASGVAVAGSDRDEEAIVIEPLSEAWSLGKPWEDTVRESPELDTKYFSLRKWCRMAANGNPNFLLMLFAPESHILKFNALGAQLREQAGLFVSKQAIRSHLGYMQGQRARMVNHNKSFGAGGGHGLPRYDLIEQYGYDTKFAMHLLRLGIQGRELAEDGRITLPVPEQQRNFLLDVRTGKLTLERILHEADVLEDGMKLAFNSSPLPDLPDLASISAWMQRVYIRTWSADRQVQDILEDAAMGRPC